MKLLTCTIKKVWAAYGTDEMGRITGRHGLFETQSQADLRAEGKGAWGGKGSTQELFCLMDVDTRDLYVLNSEHPTRLTVDIEAEEMARDQRAKELIDKMSESDAQAVFEYLSKKKNSTKG